MTSEKFSETIAAFNRRQPFKPYTIAMMNGDRVEVDFPGAIAVREGFAIFLGPGGVPHFIDHDGVNQMIGDLITRNPGE